MPIIYRTEKGAPLSINEIDTNFKELDDRLKIIEEHAEEAEGLGKVQVHEGQITLTGTFGTDFGTFPLPKASLNPCGMWLSRKTYQKLDVVTVENSLYCCLKEHTSTSWEQDRRLWQDILSLPKPPLSSLPLYEKATLPIEESTGKLAILMEEEGPCLIFFTGQNWQRLMKGAIL